MIFYFDTNTELARVGILFLLLHGDFKTNAFYWFFWWG